MSTALLSPVKREPIDVALALFDSLLPSRRARYTQEEDNGDQETAKRALASCLLASFSEREKSER